MDHATEPDALEHRLASALVECRQALADYQAGLSDAAELRRRLVVAGLVEHGDEVWILELDAARWCRFDGLSIAPAPLVFDTEQLRRWRVTLDRLHDQLHHEGPA